jgi:hypothetical protein
LASLFCLRCCCSVCVDRCCGNAAGIGRPSVRQVKPVEKDGIALALPSHLPVAPDSNPIPSVASDQGLRRFRSYTAVTEYENGGIHRSASAVGSKLTHGGPIVGSAFPPASKHSPREKGSRLARGQAKVYDAAHVEDDFDK